MFLYTRRPSTRAKPVGVGVDLDIYAHGFLGTWVHGLGMGSSADIRICVVCGHLVALGRPEK